MGAGENHSRASRSSVGTISEFATGPSSGPSSPASKQRTWSNCATTSPMGTAESTHTTAAICTPSNR
ncbi:Uncharacterised protein [Mycobacterium tuberculosis]|uniref:Uncharacterized protein n=1 Tax=Mycobacterium tuberculosis TaxID=1773 RepID=A0A0U0RVF3_MYCTX|nr:Uncharacterised protein [Mycobacterium tuberculosis]CNV51702.1 Uncharacterised protein [Mycobacterium tuberculosis]COW27905.1 Uncharacterised protein [Mycobacterium tuberculosis]